MGRRPHRSAARGRDPAPTAAFVTRLEPVPHPVVTAQCLIAQGLAVPDPLGLGLATGAYGALMSASGSAADRIFYPGPLLRATHWETTAVGELREHAATAGGAAVAGAMPRARTRAGAPRRRGPARLGVAGQRPSHALRACSQKQRVLAPGAWHALRYARTSWRVSHPGELDDPLVRFSVRSRATRVHPHQPESATLHRAKAVLATARVFRRAHAVPAVPLCRHPAQLRRIA